MTELGTDKGWDMLKSIDGASEMIVIEYQCRHRCEALKGTDLAVKVIVIDVQYDEP